MNLSWGDWFLLVVSVEYVAIAVAYWIQWNNGYAIAFLAYALANLGLAIAS